MTEKEKWSFPASGSKEVANAHRGQIRLLNWNSLGRKLATGSSDETVKIWSIDASGAGREKRDSELPIGREPNAIVWHPSHPDQLATSAADNLIKVWDVRSSKAAITVKLKKPAYLFMAWNPGNPSIIAAVQENSEVFFLDLKTQRILKTLPSKSTVNQVLFSKNGQVFYRTSMFGVEVFSFPDLIKLHSIDGHSSLLHSIDLDPKEELIASGGLDACVSVFELKTLTCLKSFNTFDQPARSVSFSSEGNYLAFFQENTPGIFIEKAISGERAIQLSTPSIVSDLRWNPKHMVLAYTGSFSEGSRRNGNFNIYTPKQQHSI